MPRFILEIGLGNDAMQTPEDVKRALAEVSRHMSVPEALDDLMKWKCALKIRDINGNTVGHYEVRE